MRRPVNARGANPSVRAALELEPLSVTPRKRLRVAPLLLLCAALATVAVGRAAAQAADPAMLAQQRSQIEAEIRHADAMFAADQAACAKRFAVTSCSEEVQLRRRETMAPLRARWLALDDVERRARAAARLQAIEDKRRAQRSAPEAPLQRVAAEPPTLVASAPLIGMRRGAAAIRQQSAHAAAAQRVAASRRRQQQADQDAARVRERLAQRESSGKKAAPLPVPR